MKSVQQRFEEKIDKTSSSKGCWLWTATTNPDGYGRFKIEGKLYGSHRVSYELYKGEISKDMFVCHHCDVRNCVNPDHLFLGTQLDNMRDCAAKGRHYLPKWVGPRLSRRGVTINNKITQSTYQSIHLHLAKGVTGNFLANLYGVSKQTISNIKNGKLAYCLQWDLTNPD